MATTVDLKFQLKIRDGWPPVPVEVLPSTKQAAGFRIEVAPLFVKDISRGDVVIVKLNARGNVSSWKHVSRSRRSTIWLGIMNGEPNLDPVFKHLYALKCNTVAADQLGCFAIDVPPECELSKVDACLEDLNADEVAIAYPSIRHKK